MAEYYAWFVLVHLIGLVIFVACHGVSMFGSFNLRRQRDPRMIATMLAGSLAATRLAYLGLLLLGLGGILAATSTNLWGQPWVIASVVLLIVILVVMYAVASPYYMGIRKTIGDGLQTGSETSPVIDQAALEATLDTRRPDILLVVGGLGLVGLIYLMVLKPA